MWGAVKHVVTGHDHLVGPWVSKKTGGTWVPGSGVTVGLFDDEKGILAGVLYDSFNGANVQMHVAAIPGRDWLCREFLWFCFYYPFVQLGCKRVTGIVSASNADARKFDEHLGFQLEATLKDAHPDGDLLVYVMHKKDCRWLNLRRGLDSGNIQKTGGADCESVISQPH